MKFDLLIKNGFLIDGTGNPYYRADIGIKTGQIAFINKDINPELTQRIIHADGLTVSPGFFDTHSHDDLYLLINPNNDEKILQGVTTVVIGNCGWSPVPISDEHRIDVEDILRALGGGQLPKENLGIYSFGDFLRKLETSKPGINIVPLVGHTTVRTAVLGSANRAPTNSELKMMKKLVDNAMEDGAFGMSTGLILAPGSYAKTDEIIELSKVISRFNGIYVSHIRSEGDFIIPAIAEAINIGKKSDVSIHISHHKLIGKNNWGKSVETLNIMAEARAKDIEVTCDQYPYRAGSLPLAYLLPPSILAGGPEVYPQKLKDPKTRDAVIAEIKKDGEVQWENLIKGAGGFENIIIAISLNHHDYIGKSIAEIAKIENKSPYDVIFDLVVEEKRGTRIIIYMMADEDINRIMANPFTMIGTDGDVGLGVSKIHPRLTGTFPRILGRYVREKGVLSLEDAIRKMTSLPAQTFGIRRKGLLKEGFDADIVIFNSETIIDKSSFEDPRQKPEGIKYVLVNGHIAVDNGEVTGGTSGKVLRYNKL